MRSLQLPNRDRSGCHNTWFSVNSVHPLMQDPRTSELQVVDIQRPTYVCVRPLSPTQPRGWLICRAASYPL